VIDRGKHNLLGVRIDAVDYAAAVERIVNAARVGQPLAVTALAVHGVLTGVLDPAHRYRLNHLDLVVPDGQPVRWALNWLHRARLTDRVYGPHLMLKVCARAAAERLPIFLYGSSAEVLAALQARLAQRFPGLRVAGARPSRFRRLSAQEQDDMVRDIRASGAALTFLGLGCPRQEICAYELRDALSMPVLAVGAAFPFHAGHLPQAPRRLQRWGLEWLFRLCSEPRRLWKRYVVLNPLYLGLLFLQMTGWHHMDPECGSTPPKEALRYG
jgi:N-acetylglucosaminyldiphosphoundecaprenol N-acetyl-beta-D-mannosaminyltransferase